ncbi:hypothetical protein [Sinomicrobium soli]|uniref:hypothetical protein n=1 Tax=Sinomicrobium sp. N-1-3-6 TaxID=2219864 RepID=UPI000DCDBF29|nr:hypothetical protein [Sinomicrobium sp. N-1-3-6]RAV28048.1 hypothetical protein DN748_15190 [Sinomicrobium sp. N-1-3-6]
MAINLKEIKTKSLSFIKTLNDKISNSSLEHFQTIVFSSSEFRDKNTLGGPVKKIKQNEYPLIYIISIPDDKARKELIRKFKCFRESNDLKTKNVDRVNLSRFNRENINSNTIYVGSSTTDFVTRIKNHLGIMGTRVYSLHLCKWDEGFNYNVNIETYEIKTTNNEKLERFAVEIIEQQIWDELRPVFGKKSGL